jgi:membrane AbrB-like protein
VNIIRTLIIGFAGGFAAWLAGMPAPWLAGSLVASIASLAAGWQPVLPEALRKAAFILLGLQTGLSVTPDTMERAQHWPLSIVGLALSVIVIVWVSMRYFRTFAGWDRASALFASLPGALSLVLLLADGSRADPRRVVVAQCIRLVLLVVMLPLLIQSVAPLTRGIAVAQKAGLADVVVLVAASTLAGLAFERLSVPAGLILGACIASAALVLSGWVSPAFPDILLVPANVVLGIMIGARLAGTSLADLRSMGAAGLVAFLLALAIAMAAAGLTSTITGLPFALTLLAYAPGGLEAMTLMAFALDLDPAFVAAHQIARYVGLVICMPWVTKLLLGAEGAPAKGERQETEV